MTGIRRADGAAATLLSAVSISLGEAMADYNQAGYPDPGSYRSDSDVNFLDLDLNLLIALDALLSHRSVTQAAAALLRSQPSLSAALKRLRHHFDDQLLVRVGNSNELTPLAVQLKPLTATALAEITKLFGTTTRFDPEGSNREFVFYSSDYGQAVLGRAMAEIMYERAPGVRLRFLPLSDATVENSIDASRTVDGFILPHGFMLDLPCIDAYTDGWVIVVDADNTEVGDAVELDELANLDWVLPFNRPGSNVAAVRQLAMLGVDLRVAIAVEGFLSLPAFVRNTRRATILPERLCRQIAEPDHYRTIACPFDAAPLTAALWWHPTLEHDPGHTWVRSIVEEAGKSLEAG
jgi:DNA-binding transcriptional LysR family regulator